MTDYTDKIKEIAKRVLDEVQSRHGHRFSQGHGPHDESASLRHIRRIVDELIWDSNCGLNLANYLTDKKGNIAIVAKGCDTRNIVTHVIENKIKREQLHIIGVPCTGMIDHHKINAMFDKEITKSKSPATRSPFPVMVFPRPFPKKTCWRKTARSAPTATRWNMMNWWEIS